MTQRTDIAKAFSCLLVCLLFGTGASAELPNGKTREGVIAGMALILTSNDSDGDGRLSRAEVQAMVDCSLAPMFKTGRNVGQLNEERSWLIDDYAAQDLDRDGYLSLDELQKEPLAEFDCADQDRDGALSQAEIEAGMIHCGSGRAHQSSF